MFSFATPRVKEDVLGFAGPGPAPRMIVTCNACQTRFRLPDDKVGPQGARVRCGRCKALFLVKRDDGAPDAVAAPAPPPARPPAGLDLDLATDPFAGPGAAPGRSAPSADPFAAPPSADPFTAPAPTPDPYAVPEVQDPFGASVRPAIDPFASPARPDPFATAAPSRPAGAQAAPPPADPFAADLLGMLPTLPPPADGGIALEEAERRQRSSPALPGYGDEDRHADFRTPGPSGLEVAERKTEEQPLQAASVPAEVPHQELPRAGAPRRAPAPDPGEPPPPAPAPSRRRILSAVLNSLSLAALLVLAAALFVYWKGGAKALWATVTGRVEEARFIPGDVSSGLYETAGGRPAFFVRGKIAVPGAVTGPIQVAVALVEGRRPVAHAEGMLGALPTPEEIWSVRSAGDADRLLVALAARAAPRAEPGVPQPFLVVFFDYPSDLRGLDLQITAAPRPGG